MKEIVIASGNRGKIEEAQEILKEFEIISIKELGIDIDVEEDKETKCNKESRNNSQKA